MAVLTLTITGARQRADGSVCIDGAFNGNVFGIEFPSGKAFLDYVNTPLGAQDFMLSALMKWWQGQDQTFTNAALVVGHTFTVNTVAAVS